MSTRRFTIRDMLVGVAIVAVLLALLVPLIQNLREDARRMTCKDRAKQTMLALHNYHSAYRQLPSAMAGTDGNANRLSGLVAMTQMYGGSTPWDDIRTPAVIGGVAYPDMGSVPWDKNYKPWTVGFEEYLCPSSPHPVATGFRNTNFAFCIGDNITNIHNPKPLTEVRGLFSPRVFTRFRDNLDGLSNTIAISEIATMNKRRVNGQFAINMPASLADRPSDCLKTVDPKRAGYYTAKVTLSDLGRGGNWADGAGGYALMQTILPPNSPSCAIGGSVEVDGIFSASSWHEGGCHIAMADGAVTFVSESIDTGNLSATAPVTARKKSPYGLWGALGTRASKEIIGVEDRP